MIRIAAFGLATAVGGGAKLVCGELVHAGLSAKNAGTH
jgi:hypothetical protein